MIRAISGIGDSIVFKSGVPISVVCVAATFTSVTYANNGGKVQLVSSGVHGLTTSPAVGASVYVSWAGGTGVSGLYNILSIDNTLNFTIDLTYAAGLGTPTVVKNNTVFTVAPMTLPSLTGSSKIRCEFNSDITGSTNSKVVAFYLNLSEAISSNTNTAATRQNNFRGVISNMGVTNSQTCTYYGATNIVHQILSEETSVSATLRLRVMFGAANEIITITHYIVEVFI